MVLASTRQPFILGDCFGGLPVMSPLPNGGGSSHDTAGARGSTGPGVLSFLVVGVMAGRQVAAGSSVSRCRARSNASAQGRVRSIRSQRRWAWAARWAGMW